MVLIFSAEVYTTKESEAMAGVNSMQYTRLKEELERWDGYPVGAMAHPPAYSVEEP